MYKQIGAAVLLLATACASANAQQQNAVTPGMDSPPPIEVMVVGSFHMNNPGRDVVNAEVDSMLTEQRQSEIAATVNALAAFKPTVIAIERQAAAPDYIDPQFAAHSPDDLLENADERYQLGYRLADMAGVTRVYGIDEQPDGGEPDYFPFGKLMAHIEASGQAGAMNAKMARTQDMMTRFEDMQKTRSVAELLIFANDYDGLANPDFYYETFAFDIGEDQPGAELQAYWFMRNAKIFSKLAQVTKPGDRVVVIYGAGHKFWLDHFADHTPGFVSVNVMPYLAKVAAK